MALFSLDGVPQPPIGQQEHWRLFERFVGSELHTAIVSKLRSYLDGDHIDSPQVGSQVLRAIRTEAPDYLDSYSVEAAGGLFGMTLWNLLAEHSARWMFYPKKADAHDDVTGTVYFRAKA